MKKRVGILFAMIILIGIPFAVKASESDQTSIRSYGNIFYEDATGSVKIYAEDIAFLQEKLSSIPDEIFDPLLYSHDHVWEYRDITDQGHTKHCDVCGSKYDVINMHTMDEQTECILTFKGEEYLGYEKVCECGFKWVEEAYHNLIYTQKDDMYHTSSCVLEGTSYCSGMEQGNSLHLINLYPTDSTHHRERCDECGYEGNTSECIFEIAREDVEGEEPDPDEAEEDRKYCACGNYMTEPETDVTDAEITDQKNSDTRIEAEETYQDEDGEVEEDTVVTDPDEASEISVSGNDIIQEIIKKEGEDDL